jgi:hypothetical protein
VSPGSSACIGDALGGGLGQLVRTQNLAVGTIPAHFRASEKYLKAEMRLDLAAQPLQRFAKEFLHTSAPEANHVRMFAFHARLVIMLIAGVVHEVKLIHKAAVLQHLQSAVYRDAIHLRVPFTGKLEKLLGIEVRTGCVNQVEQNLALACETHAALAKRILYSLGGRLGSMGIAFQSCFRSHEIITKCDVHRFEVGLKSQSAVSTPAAHWDSASSAV